MAAAEYIVDVHHHFMPPPLFDRLAAQAGGKRIVTNEISLTLHPSRKDLDAHMRCMDEAGITVSILTDQVQVLGTEVARALNDGIAAVEKRYPDRFRGCIHLPVHEPAAAKRELERGMDELGLRAVEPALDLLADDELERRGAVVGAPRPVGPHRAPELGEGHQRDPVGEGRLEGGEERVDGVVELPEEDRVAVAVAVVQVKGGIFNLTDKGKLPKTGHVIAVNGYAVDENGKEWFFVANPGMHGRAIKYADALAKEGVIVEKDLKHQGVGMVRVSREVLEDYMKGGGAHILTKQP